MSSTQPLLPQTLTPSPCSTPSPCLTPSPRSALALATYRALTPPRVGTRCKEDQRGCQPAANAPRPCPCCAQVLKVTVAKKINEIVNRLEKTCEERHPDLEAEQQVYMRHVREANKVVERQQRRAEKAAKEEARRAEEQRSYRHIMKEEYMESNQDNAAKYKSVEELEDDFM
eukprot:362089-Chlamydomonas_euryale.AAC.2